MKYTVLITDNFSGSSIHQCEHKRVMNRQYQILHYLIILKMHYFKTDILAIFPMNMTTMMHLMISISKIINDF